MKYQFIDKYRFEFRVEKMCRVLEVSRSGYYAWKRRPQSSRSQANGKLLKQIEQVHKENREVYGSIRVTKALNKKKINCGKNRVARLMKENHICSKRKRKFKATTNSNHRYPVAENLLNQNFKVSKANEVWVADITYIPTDEGWLYLAGVVDLYHKQVIGWSMDSTMTKELVIKALNQAILRAKPVAGVIHHSDRGSQYASYDYQAVLQKHGFKGSMSRKGNCYDNACMESFFGTLKNELIYLNHYRTRAEARQAVFDYIEIFYNRVRLHSSLGYMTPEAYGRDAIAA